MLAPDLHAALARELQQAQATRQPVMQFSRRHPEMTVDDAYAVQREWIHLQREAGARVVGHKVGLTSRAMQQAAQIDEPDHGTLLDDMVLHDGDTVPASRYLYPRLEVEFGFVLARDLRGPGVATEDVLRATERVVPALELIDARIEAFDRDTRAPRRVVDTIADNAASAGVVLSRRSFAPDAIDWRWAGALFSRNGVIEESGLGAAVLDHPANGVAWLANKRAAYGESLRAGDLVLAGSFTRPVACVAGDTFVADYGPLGTITLRFS